jgi:hypothetical protein
MSATVKNQAMLSRKDFSDIEFILQETQRLQSLDVGKLMEFYKENPREGLHTISTGPGGRQFLSTSAASQRFRQITSRGLRALGESAIRFDPDDLVGSLRTTLAATISDGSLMELTDENAHSLFEKATALSESRHEAFVRHIPCYVVSHTHPETFNIGPVNFMLMKRFLAASGEVLRTEAKWLGKDGVSDLIKYLSEFTWLASIQVGKCAPVVARRWATTGVQVALDLLKLFGFPERTKRVGHADSPGHRHALFDVGSRTDGTFTVSFQRQGKDAIISDDWYRMFTSTAEWRVAESLINANWVAWGSPSEPVLRFVEGLTWYGDAVVDPEANSRTVKYWTSIERTLSLTRGDDFVRRAATISLEKDGNYTNWRSMCERSYGHRSAIVHGARRYSPQESNEIAVVAAKFSRSVLLGYLGLASWARSLENLNKAHLTRAFSHLDKMTKTAEREAAS